MSTETIFDKIIRKEIAANVVFEDEHVLAFEDINPQAPTHVLVIPKTKVARFAELNDQSVDMVGHFFQRVSAVANELNLVGPGFRVVINNGRDGGQEVEYLHAHILGGRAMTWPPG